MSDIYPSDPPLVKATACTVVDVKRPGKLLTELNELNARCRDARVYRYGRTVMVEQSLLAQPSTVVARPGGSVGSGRCQQHRGP